MTETSGSTANRAVSSGCRLRAPGIVDLGLLLPILVFGFYVTSARAAPELLNTLKSAVASVCAADLSRDPESLAVSFGSVVAVRDRGSLSAGMRRTFDIKGPGENMTRIGLVAFQGGIRRVRGEIFEPYDDVRRPLALVDTGGDCSVLRARMIRYDASGTADRILHFDRELNPEGPGEPLNPDVPEGRDPGGIAIAHIDSGVNYLLPEIAGRLARAEDGTMLGYDFWDRDERPFDIDTGRSAFFPIRHGTSVASVLLREAPDARLVPYRYPRPDLSRLKSLIEHAAAHNIKIAMMPLGSRKRADWEVFAEEARNHPDMLFVVSAGNDGRNLDVDPLYPAALELENMIVVTSSDASGRLAPGSNWGVGSVDIMAPGEQVAVTDHRGAAGFGSGSSFAVPRVAALAARLAERNPDWNAKALKAAIRARTGRSFERGGAKVGWGWIPNPADDG